MSEYIEVLRRGKIRLVVMAQSLSRRKKKKKLLRSSDIDDLARNAHRGWKIGGSAQHLW